MEQNSSGREPAGGFDRDRLRAVQNWRRSRSDRLIAGVCGGVGRALDIDPVLVRVVVGVLVVLGPGLPLYLAGWALMPSAGSDRSVAQDVLGDRVRPDHPWLWPTVIGIGVFVAIIVSSSVDSGPFKLGPLLVIGAIWYVFFYKKGPRSQRPGQTPPVSRPGPPVAPPMPTPGTPQAWTTPGTPQTGSPLGKPQDGSTLGKPQDGTTLGRPQDVPRPQDSPTTSVQPVWTEDDPLGLYVDEPPAPRQTSAPVVVPAHPGLRIVKPLVMSATLLAITIAWIAQASLPLMLAIGLATLGLGMILGGFAGRTLGLLPLGILLALGVAATQVFPTVPKVREINYVASPQTPITADLPAFAVDAGTIRIDLTKAEFSPGAKVVATSKAGEIVVVLPKDVDVTGLGKAQMGAIQAFGGSKGGYDFDQQFSDLGVDAKAGPASVRLELTVTTGSIVVERR
ncbi:PspC domain-containing protein [Kribbella deserti]|uniref:PspC domain-containing protein n=1 Tax=Kribbella deserti TaxID=1926257 RepID=A0ABV6QGH5_9ACTN